MQPELFVVRTKLAYDHCRVPSLLISIPSNITGSRQQTSYCFFNNYTDVLDLYELSMSRSLNVAASQASQE